MIHKKRRGEKREREKKGPQSLWGLSFYYFCEKKALRNKFRFFRFCIGYLKVIDTTKKEKIDDDMNFFLKKIT